MSQTIDFLNATREEIEQKLLEGAIPADVAIDLQEPLPNVLGVWQDLRNAGKVQPRNTAARPQNARPAAAPPAPPVEPEDSISRLIDQASGSGSAAIKRLAGKLDLLVEDLRGKLDDLAAKEREKAAAEAERAAARRRIDALEQQLAEAKAALRGKPSTSAKPASADPPPSEVRAWAKENGVDCPDRGIVPRRVVDAFRAR